MKSLANNIKVVTATIGLTALFSLTANAEPVPFQQALANAVVAQGQAVTEHIANDVQQSIKQHLAKFSIDSTVLMAAEQAEDDNIKLAKTENDDTEQQDNE